MGFEGKENNPFVVIPSQFGEHAALCLLFSVYAFIEQSSPSLPRKPPLLYIIMDTALSALAAVPTAASVGSSPLDFVSRQNTFFRSDH